MLVRHQRFFGGPLFIRRYKIKVRKTIRRIIGEDMDMEPFEIEQGSIEMMY